MSTQQDDTTDPIDADKPVLVDRALAKTITNLLRDMIREHTATDSKGRRTATRSRIHIMAERIQKKENDLRSARG